MPKEIPRLPDSEMFKTTSQHIGDSYFDSNGSNGDVPSKELRELIPNAGFEHSKVAESAVITGSILLMIGAASKIVLDKVRGSNR